MSALDRFTDALEAAGSSRRGTNWQCPAHEDRQASLSVSGGRQGALVHCHAGCSTLDVLDVLDVLGLEWGALFDEPTAGKGWSTSTLRRVGAKTNGDGRVQLGGVRYLPGGSPKSLAVKGEKRDLWPDPATVTGDTIYVLEGEPDAVTAAQLGLPAVAIPGAGKWRPAWAQRIAHGRRRVVILPDADEPGRTAAAKWASALAEHVADVRVLDLDPQRSDGYDLGDFAAEAGTDQDRACAREAIERAVEALAPLPGNAATSATGATGAELLHEIRGFIRRYVVLPGEHEEVAIALFVAHTWAFEAAPATPYVVVQSPEKQSGKTRLLEVVSVLVREPLQVASASEAALYRTIEATRCTLLLDQVDAIFAQNTERTEALRGLINSGNRASGRAIRCVGQSLEPKAFSTFCPKVLAGIDEGRLPDTITDRAIEVRMKRKLAGERVERFRERNAAGEAGPLLDALRAWAADAGGRLAEMEPELPDELGDRAAEAWEPLLAIADEARGEWPRVARAAATALSGERATDDDGSVQRRMLAAIRKVWEPDDDRLSSAELCRRLSDDNELPYAGWSDGRGINPSALAKYLKPYGITSVVIRVGDTTPRGYRRDAFHEAWERYLPPDVAPVADVAPITGQAASGAPQGLIEGSGGVGPA